MLSIFITNVQFKGHKSVQRKLEEMNTVIRELFILTLKKKEKKKEKIYQDRVLIDSINKPIGWLPGSIHVAVCLCLCRIYVLMRDSET